MKLEGHRVAHRELDDTYLGSAKAGTVEEVIDLGDQSLVATRFDDGETAIIDKREVIDLGRKGTNNQTPIILRKRHLLAMARRRLTLLSALLTLTFLGFIWVFLNQVNQELWVKLVAGILALAFMSWSLSKLLSTDYLISKER